MDEDLTDSTDRVVAKLHTWRSAQLANEAERLREWRSDQIREELRSYVRDADLRGEHVPPELRHAVFPELGVPALR